MPLSHDEARFKIAQKINISNFKFQKSYDSNNLVNLKIYIRSKNFNGMVSLHSNLAIH